MARPHFSTAPLDSEDDFERLCRVIMLTEQRGYAQVSIILKNRLIISDPVMNRRPP